MFAACSVLYPHFNLFLFPGFPSCPIDVIHTSPGSPRVNFALRTSHCEHDTCTLWTLPKCLTCQTGQTASLYFDHFATPHMNLVHPDDGFFHAHDFHHWKPYRVCAPKSITMINRGVIFQTNTFESLLGHRNFERHIGSKTRFRFLLFRSQKHLHTFCKPYKFTKTHSLQIMHKAYTLQIIHTLCKSYTCSVEHGDACSHFR